MSQHSPSRREFLAASLAGIGSVSSLGPVSGVWAAESRWSRGAPDLATFSAMLGQRFRARADSLPGVHLELIEVKSLGSPYRTGGDIQTNEHARITRRTEAFSLLFRVVRGGQVAQATFLVKHPQLGRLPIFLVPVGPGAGYCEAIFA